MPGKHLTHVVKAEIVDCYNKLKGVTVRKYDVVATAYDVSPKSVQRVILAYKRDEKTIFKKKE